MIVLMVAFWLAGLQSAWDVRQWGALIPDELGITTSQFFAFLVLVLRRI